MMIKVLMLSITAMFLFGMPSYAIAQDKEKLTAGTCIKKTSKSEKLACFDKLKIQRANELEIARTEAETAKAEARKLDIEISALQKVEALQKKKEKKSQKSDR